MFAKSRDVIVAAFRGRFGGYFEYYFYFYFTSLIVTSSY